MHNITHRITARKNFTQTIELGVAEIKVLAAIKK
jgi:hypothetical protein